MKKKKCSTDDVPHVERQWSYALATILQDDIEAVRACRIQNGTNPGISDRAVQPNQICHQDAVVLPVETIRSQEER